MPFSHKNKSRDFLLKPSGHPYTTHAYTHVTRFGKNSPHWQTFKNLIQTFEGISSVWQKILGSYCIDFTLKTEIKAIISMPEL